MNRGQSIDLSQSKQESNNAVSIIKNPELREKNQKEIDEVKFQNIEKKGEVTKETQNKTQELKFDYNINNLNAKFEQFFNGTRDEINNKIQNLNDKDYKLLEIYLKGNIKIKKNFLDKNKGNKKGNYNIELNGGGGLVCPIQRKAANLLETISKNDFEESKNNIKNFFLERFNGEKNLVDILMNKIEKSIDKNPCTFDLIVILDDFNKNEIQKYNRGNRNDSTKHIKPFTETESIDSIQKLLKLKKEENTGEIKLLSLQIQIIKKDSTLSKEEKNQKVFVLEEKIKRLKENKQEVNKSLGVANSITSKNIYTVINLKKEGKTNKEIKDILRKDNKELDKVLSNFEEKNKNQQDNFKQNINQNFEKENIIYTQIDKNLWQIETNGKIIDITDEEKEIVENNPEALDNLINFYDFFEDLNLKSVWKYRNELINSMDDVFIDIKDNNSLSKNELKKFGNKLIQFINNISYGENKQKVKLNKSGTIGGIKNQLRIYSGANSIFSDKKTSNIYGEDRFASDLRKLGIIGNSLGFGKNIFRSIIKGKNKVK